MKRFLIVVCLFKGHDYRSWRKSLSKLPLVPTAKCSRCGLEP